MQEFVPVNFTRCVRRKCRIHTLLNTRGIIDWQKQATSVCILANCSFVNASANIRTRRLDLSTENEGLSFAVNEVSVQ